MQFFGQTLLHLLETQRMVQKGGAHKADLSRLLYATKETDHKDPLSLLPVTQWLFYHLCGYGGMGGPRGAHSWGYRAKKEPTSWHHLDPEGPSSISPIGKQEMLSGEQMARHSKGIWNY